MYCASIKYFTVSQTLEKKQQHNSLLLHYYATEKENNITVLFVEECPSAWRANKNVRVVMICTTVVCNTKKNIFALLLSWYSDHPQPFNHIIIPFQCWLFRLDNVYRNIVHNLHCNINVHVLNNLNPLNKFSIKRL